MGQAKTKQRAAEEKQVAETSAELTAAKTPKRGGRRAGAGRKPNYLRKSGLPPVLAHAVLAQHDVLRLWGELLNCQSPDIRLRTLMYLTDREQGKATQSTELSGALVVQHADVAERIRQLEKELGYSPAADTRPLIQPVNSPAEPVPDKVLPPPPPLVLSHRTLECTKHGPYSKSWDSKGDLCMIEGEQDAQRLASMLPGGDSA